MSAPVTGLSVLDSLRSVQAQSLGHPDVCVAVLDGPTDLSHPCFLGADLTRLDTLVPDAPGTGAMSRHGTHVTSVIFGQPASDVVGIAPRCRGLILPVFRDDQNEGRLSQLDLARAISQAVEEGAHIINVSGGERSPTGEADGLLARALRSCAASNVLVVAAAGNDGCDCLHVPAAFSSALAVGAMGTDGTPFETSNWGEAYTSNGVLGPGQNILGAVPGGGTVSLTGSSFATPIVSGLAALLLSIQRLEGGSIDPQAIRTAILETAVPCPAPHSAECDRYLVGSLNVQGAYARVTKGGKSAVPESNLPQVPSSAATTSAAHVDESNVPRVPSPAVETGAAHVPSGDPATSEVDAITSATTSEVDAIAPAISPSRFGEPAMGEPTTHAGASPMARAAAEPLSQGTADPAPAEGIPSPAAGISVAHAQTADAATWDGATAPSIAPSAATATGYPGSQAAPSDVPGATARLGSPPGATAVTRGSTGSTGLAPSGDCNCAGAPLSYVFPIGNVDTDFGSETGRDAFRQLMPRQIIPGSPPTSLPPNPYDVAQLVDYLDANPWESTKLIWTINLESAPVYAIIPEPAYAEEVYRVLRAGLRNSKTLPSSDPAYVSRVSLAGVLTNKTTRLFSGQILPVVVAQPRGLYTWNEGALVNASIDAVQAVRGGEELDREFVAGTVRNFLDKVYFELRNLGREAHERALNFAATNLFIFTEGLAEGILSARLVPGGPPPETGARDLYTLDTIDVVKSPFCRHDSICYDVRVKFFNPKNEREAKTVYQFTVDVSGLLPVSIAPSRQFLVTS